MYMSMNYNIPTMIYTMMKILILNQETKMLSNNLNHYYNAIVVGIDRTHTEIRSSSSSSRRRMCFYHTRVLITHMQSHIRSRAKSDILFRWFD